MKGRGQNIPLVTGTGSGGARKLFTKLNPARGCVDHSTPTEQVTPGEGLVQPKFDKVKGFFHEPLGLKNTILRGSRGKIRERSRPEYSSGDRYWITVVHESFLQSSILHAFV